MSTITTATIPAPNLSEWKRRLIKEGGFKYLVNLHEVGSVYFFKTIKEVKAFVARLPYYQRHNYEVWKMMAAIDVDRLTDGDRYWLFDLSYTTGGITAYGDQWKGEGLRNNIGRPNCYFYRSLSDWSVLQRNK